MAKYINEIAGKKSLLEKKWCTFYRCENWWLSTL